jgi:hypothetical protein
MNSIMGTQTIDVSQAAKILGLTTRNVRYMCERGHFSTAYKPGMGWWKVSKEEIILHKNRIQIHR